MKIKKTTLLTLIIIMFCAIMPFYTNITSSETASELQIDYTVNQVNETNADILIMITEESTGIKKVEYPDGYEVFVNGEEKRTKLAIDYEAQLGEEYTFKITTGDGVETEKKIVVINNFEISASEITTTGFAMNLSLTSAELAKIEEIRYYVNTSSSGTSYQTSNIVTGLSENNSRYIWAEIIYNGGIIKKSKNYRCVYTAHNHNSNCYNYTYTNVTSYAFKAISGSGHNDYSEKYNCYYCGRYLLISSWPGNGSYYLEDVIKNTDNTDYRCDARAENGYLLSCGEIGDVLTLDIKYVDTSANGQRNYERYCPRCKEVEGVETNILDYAINKGLRHCHYKEVENLICGIPEGVGRTYNYYF